MKGSFVTNRKNDRKMRRSTCLIMCFVLVMALIVQASVLTQTAGAAGEKTIRKQLVDPFGDGQNYLALMYDNTNGMPAPESNDIVQTSNGFIWIGSYGGLIRYDGNTFERVDTIKEISSVDCLYVDSKDRLWIGTNENGVALREGGEYRLWSEDEGLGSSKATSIGEGKDGTIYVGSTSGMAVITEDLKLEPLDDPKIANACLEQIRTGKDGTIYCITTEGDYFTLRDRKLVDYIDHKNAPIKAITAIYPDPDDAGKIYIGTEQSEIYRCSTEGGYSKPETIDISPLSAVNQIKRINDRTWVCARDGIGVIDESGFHLIKDLPFRYTINSVIEDYQGNLWFASSRQGVMMISPNRFTDVFARYNIAEQVVNSTCLLGKDLYVGTDSGLMVIGKNGPLSQVPVTEARYASGEALAADDLIGYLEGCRIRSIIRDSKDRLWISTWQTKGLLRYDHGKLTAFTEGDGDLPSDRIRVVHEMKDGTMLAASTGGVCVIKGDKVTRVYGEKDGIENIETLSIETAPNGDILLGSNGGGIYILTDKGTKTISRDDGLTSGVIMRIKYDKDNDVFWLVEGNSIAYMSADYKVTPIKEFPYSDNLDIFENSRKEMWILSSDGIYVLPTKELIENKKIEPLHYGIANGLPCTMTSNSHSELTEKGNLFMSGNTGVVKVNIEDPDEDLSDIKLSIPFIEADGERIYGDEDGTFEVPSDVTRITVHGFVLNYSLNDPWVSYKLDGFDRDQTTLKHSELQPVTYTNLRGGTYKFKLQLKDSEGDSGTVEAVIIKKKAIYEYLLFNIALLALLGLLAIFLTRRYFKKKMDDLEERHREEQERARVSRELSMANTIQMAMLPHEFPPFPDRHEFNLYASMEPAREVGGDFYNYFMIDDDHLCLVMADVSGKGVPAALFMMVSDAILQSTSTAGRTPSDILERTNKIICSNNQLEMFVTTWLGILEISTGKLIAANAGHEYPAIKRADGEFELFKDKHGFVLAAMEGIKYTDYELQLEPGDKMFLYTDGVAEATDAENNMFGTDRMLEALNRDRNASPEELLGIVREAVSDFVKEAEQFDDLTMLCFVYNGASDDSANGAPDEAADGAVNDAANGAAYEAAGGTADEHL